jgi:hypothetical protein
MIGTVMAGVTLAQTCEQLPNRPNQQPDKYAVTEFVRAGR